MVWNEKRIKAQYGTSYDHPKEKLPNRDNDHFPATYRILTRWHLTKNTPDDHARRELPEGNGNLFNGEYNLFGLLIPVPSEVIKFGSRIREKSMIITELVRWVIDCNTPNYGIYVLTNSNTWYYLTEPCRELISMKKNDIVMQLPSQLFVHRLMRAKLGLLFNMIDMFTGNSELGDVHSLKFYSKKSIFTCQKGLDPTGRPMNLVMFDFELLKLYPSFIKENLRRFSKVFQDEHCQLMKSINVLQSKINSRQFTAPAEIQSLWRSFNYDPSAHRSEARHPLRMPWGAIKLQENPTPDGSLEDSHLVSLEDSSTITSETNGATSRSASTPPPRVNEHGSQSTPDLEKRGRAIPRSQRAMKRQRSVVSADEEEQNHTQGTTDESSDPIATDPDVISATPQSVLGTADQILNEIDRQQDFSVQAPVASFSKENMADALRTLCPYLEPTPTDEDIENCNHDKFKINEKGKDEFVDKMLRTDDVDSMEFMLLAVKSIIKSDPTVKKKLLTVKPWQDIRVGGQYIFKNWLCYAIEIMERKRLVQNELPEEERVEEMVASSILELIYRFDVIKKKAKLGIMEKRFNIRWEDIVKKTLAFSSVHNISEIMSKSYEAKNFLRSSFGEGTIKSPKPKDPKKEKQARLILEAAEKAKERKKKNASKFVYPLHSPNATVSTMPSPGSSSKPIEIIELNDDEDESPPFSESESWDRQRQGRPKEEWNGGPQYDDSNTRYRTGQYDHNAVKGEDFNGGSSYDGNGRRNDEEWNGSGQTNYKNRRNDDEWNNGRDRNTFNNRRNDEEWNMNGQNNYTNRRTDGEWKNGRDQNDFQKGRDDNEWNNPRDQNDFKKGRDDNEWNNQRDQSNFNSRRGDDGMKIESQDSGDNRDRRDNWKRRDEHDFGDKRNGENFSERSQQYNNDRKSGGDGWNRGPQHDSNPRRNEDDWNGVSEYDININDRNGRGLRNDNDRNRGSPDDLNGNRNGLTRAAPSHKGGWNDESRDYEQIGNFDDSGAKSKHPSPPYVTSSPPYESSPSPYDGMQSLNEVRRKGTGRGKDMTVPAWMTKGREGRSGEREVTSTNGGGRGRERTIPAWMSTENNSSRTITQSKSVGRGRELTKPAWLTRNNNQRLNNIDLTNDPDSDGSSSEDEDDKKIKNMQFFTHSSWKSLSGVLPGSMRGSEKNDPSSEHSRGGEGAANRTRSSQGSDIIDGNGARSHDLNWIEDSDEEGEVVDSEISKASSKRKSDLPHDNQNKKAKYDSSATDRKQSTGIGRGKSTTAPAWMTRQKKFEAAGEMREMMNNSRKGSSVSTPQLSDKEYTSGIGRGKGMTIPAWMAKKERDLEMNANNRTSSPLNISSTKREGENKISNQQPRRKPASGTGTGRGRGMTTPAWMTKLEKEENRDLAATKDSIRVSESNSERSLGRGRGMTTPAWMTKQERTWPNDEGNSVITTRRESEMTEDRVNTTKEEVKSPSARGYSIPADDKGKTGRGRGRSMTKPAWMTSQAKKEEAGSDLDNKPQPISRLKGEVTGIKEGESPVYERTIHPKFTPPERARKADAPVGGNPRFTPPERTRKTEDPVAGNPRFTPPPKKQQDRSDW